jgi:hypothetical protein
MLIGDLNAKMITLKHKLSEKMALASDLVEFGEA